jgi:hypothetical protein
VTRYTNLFSNKEIFRSKFRYHVKNFLCRSSVQILEKANRDKGRTRMFTFKLRVYSRVRPVI